VDLYVTLLDAWRQVRRHPRWLALVAAVAVLIGGFVAFRPGLPPETRQYQVWLASGDILVDTSESQVADTKGPDFLTMANRATVLGNLVVSKPLRTAIAADADVPVDQLVVVPPTNTTIPGAAPTPSVVSTGPKVPDADATVLTLTTDATLPILRVSAQAPEGETASRLAEAAFQELKGYIGTVGASAEIPAARKLVVRQLATPTPAPDTRGPGLLLGLVTGFLLAVVGCAAIATAVRVDGRRGDFGHGDHQRPEPEAETAAPDVAEARSPSLITVTFDRERRDRERHEQSDERVGAAVGAGSAIEAAPEPPRRKRQPRLGRKNGKAG
jgi:hypothetical protein